MSDTNKGLRDVPRSMPTNDKYRDKYDDIFKKESPCDKCTTPCARPART